MRYLTKTEQDLLLHPPIECGATSEDVLSLLEIYLPIFDKVLFFGLFVNDNFNGLRVHQVLSARQKISIPFGDQVPVSSVSTPRLLMSQKENQDCSNFINTLLHEMVHAFLWMYSCRCWSQGCGAAWREGTSIGKTGHGYAWCCLMADMHLLCSEILDGILISNSCFRLMRKEGGIQIWVLLSGILVGGRLGRLMPLRQGTDRKRYLRGLKWGHKVRDM